MLGNIVKWGAISIGLFAMGWTACLVYDNWTLFVLDWKISTADILSVVVNVFLAIIVANIIEKSIQDSRIEKDFFIKEIDTISDTLSDLDQICSRETVLSFNTTVYEISRCRKMLLRVWKTLEEFKPGYAKHHKSDKTELLGAMKDLTSQLTDVKSYDGCTGIQPIRINKGHIFLNAAVKPQIDKRIADIKDKLLKLKININKI